MKLALALLALAPSLSFAALKTGTYDAYLIKENGPVKVQFVADFETTDSCNQFGITGKMKGTARDSQSIEQLFVADFGIVQTEMGCNIAPQPRKIHVETDPFLIRPISGTVYARVLVPQGFALKQLP